MTEHQIQLKKSVVAVCDARGRIVGTGFFVRKQTVITCAHVIIESGSGPGEVVPVRLAEPDLLCEAFVSEKDWSSPEDDDIALLQIRSVLSVEVEPLLININDAQGSMGHPFRSFGYPVVGEVAGIWATGKIEGLVHEAGRDILQLTSQHLAPGMSGAPILDETSQRVVGMLASVYYPKTGSKHRDTSFAIPAKSFPKAVADQASISSLLNPFFSGGRINNPRMFFGRERLIREIRFELSKGSNVSLQGDSQIGKSSLLYYLYMTRAEWMPTTTIEYIDLQGVMDESDFYETILRKLGEKGDTPRAFKRVLENRHAILLLDELERIAAPDFSPRLHDLLRSLAQEQNFALCVATQQPLDLVFADHARNVSPLHNIFTSKVVGPFTPNEAKAFLLARLSETCISFNNAEINELVAKSEGHPARLQRMAGELFNAYADGK